MSKTAGGLSDPDKEKVAKLSQAMLRAAGGCKPEHLGRAAMIVLELAFMTVRPDAYIDWKNEQEAKTKGKS
jgi:hypothetical protein